MEGRGRAWLIYAGEQTSGFLIFLQRWNHQQRRLASTFFCKEKGGKASEVREISAVTHGTPLGRDLHSVCNSSWV